MDLSEPHPAAPVPCRPPRRGGAHVWAGGLVFAGLGLLAVGLAQGTPAADQGARTDALAVYSADLESALRLSGPATSARAEAVDDARSAYAAARRGLSAVGTFAPAAEHERDLLSGVAAWDVELELALSGVYRYDRANVLEAAIALERAEARLRDQRRDDLRAVLLALSSSRLSAMAVEEAGQDVEETAAELAEATAAGSDARELDRLRIEAELAVIDLERARLEHRDSSQALADSGFTADPSPAAATVSLAASAWLVAPPSPQLRFAQDTEGRTAPAGLLALELELTEQESALAPFEVFRQLEVYGSYEAGGLAAGARLALERGVPTTEATLGWQYGDDDRTLTLGVGATFRLSDTSSATTTVALREVSEARAALTDFLEGWPARERTQHRLTALAYEEFLLEVESHELATAELAELTTVGSAGASARNAVLRSRAASERAWQRYVREFTAYLDVIDVVLRID